MLYSNVIFDCDGTLVDVLAGARLAIEEVIEVLKLEKTLMSMIDLSSRTIEQYFEEVYRLSGRSGNFLEARDIWKDFYYGNYDKKLVLFPDVKRVVTSLHSQGAKLFVAANRDHQSTLDIIEDLLPLFDEVVTNDLLSCPAKPDPAMINYLMENHCLDPRDTCLVGDTVNDEGAARNAGISFVKVATGWPGNPDYYHSGYTKLSLAIRSIM